MRLLAIAFLSFVAAAGSAHAHGVASLRAELAAFAEEEDGVSAVEIVTGRLGIQKEIVHAFSLSPLSQYVVLAVTEDAGAIHLAARTDEKGGLTWEDETDDPGPKLEIDEHEGSRLFVTLEMSDCGKADCAYALGLYRLSTD